MATEQFEIKCAKCNVPLQGPSDPKPQDYVSCPNCGAGDNLEEILREVGEHAEEQLADGFARSMRAAIRGNKYVKFIEKPRAKRSHRFIVDLRL